MKNAAGGINQLIRKRIEDKGPMSFRDFMETALYHPEYGYYTCLDSGVAPDFYTSPEISPAFGYAVAEQIKQMMEFRGLIENDTFTIIEMGGGSGKLALQILERLSGSGCSMNYIMVEISPALKSLQKKNLSSCADNVTWSSWEELFREHETLNGVILGNEFIDALPFRRFRGTEEGVMEICVGISADGFTEVLAEPDKAFTARLPVLAPEQEIEFSGDAAVWLKEASELMNRGFLLLFDYGESEESLIREGGTVRGFKGHTVSPDCLSAPGTADITASVNFSFLEREAVKCGFETAGYTGQGNFLMSVGILDLVSSMDFEKFSRDKMGFMLGIKRLIMPDGLGESHKAAAFSKGFSSDVPKLKGFIGL